MVRNRAALLTLIDEELQRGNSCPCRGSNEMCGCQNRPPLTISPPSMLCHGLGNKKAPTLSRRGQLTEGTMRCLCNLHIAIGYREAPGAHRRSGGNS